MRNQRDEGLAEPRYVHDPGEEVDADRGSGGYGGNRARTVGPDRIGGHERPEDRRLGISENLMRQERPERDRQDEHRKRAAPGEWDARREKDDDGYS